MPHTLFVFCRNMAWLRLLERAGFPALQVRPTPKVPEAMGFPFSAVWDQSQS